MPRRKKYSEPLATTTDAMAATSTSPIDPEAQARADTEWVAEAIRTRPAWHKEAVACAEVCRRNESGPCVLGLVLQDEFQLKIAECSLSASKIENSDVYDRLKNVSWTAIAVPYYGPPVYPGLPPVGAPAPAPHVEPIPAESPPPPPVAPTKALCSRCEEALHRDGPEGGHPYRGGALRGEPLATPEPTRRAAACIDDEKKRSAPIEDIAPRPLILTSQKRAQRGKEPDNLMRILTWGVVLWTTYVAGYLCGHS